MSTVSPEQVATRRRALGRMMASKAMSISVLCEDMKSSSDLQFLSARERELFDKQMEVLQKVVGNFAKFSSRLEASE